MTKGFLRTTCLCTVLAAAPVGAAQADPHGPPPGGAGYPYAPPPPGGDGNDAAAVVLGAALGAGVATLLTAPRPAPTTTVVASPPPTVIYVQPAPVVPAAPVCRDFQSMAVIDGVSRLVRGTACLQPDGTWRATP